MKKLSLLLFLLGTFFILPQAIHAQVRPDLPQAALDHMPVCPPGPKSETPRCHARVVVDSHGKPQVNSNAVPSGYGPLQLQKAYGLGSTSNTRILAIVDAYDHPNIQSDLNVYSDQFGIPRLPACSGPIAGSAVPCFQKIDQNGGTAYPSTDSGWALETSLDVEIAHAMCTNCKILLVEANSSSYSDLMTALDRAVSSGAAVVSNSYGSAEFSSEGFFDSHFNRPGIAFTFSSGDSGYGSSYPAASPYVTAVGGTTLYLNPDNSYLSESAWNGSGSGCSKYEPKPFWQKDLGCSKRTIADVSADADPFTGVAVYDSVPYNGSSGWFQVGGTSLASPIIAAAYAISGVPSGTAANSLPYLTSSAAYLHDITTGSNGRCTRNKYLCTAVKGYDGPTGMGTPNGSGAL